jgi:hypothetical protein
MRRNSTLALLVPRIFADHPQHAPAAQNFALRAHFFDRRPDFHNFLRLYPINALPEQFSHFIRKLLQWQSEPEGLSFFHHLVNVKSLWAGG